MLTTLLEQVSRSFYLTLRVLPVDIRPQIGLAYLLARTTDTVADTAIVPLEERLDLLRRLRERILGRSSERLNIPSLSSNQATSGERVLLENVERSLQMLEQVRLEDKQLIRSVVDTITGAQILDLERFGSATRECPQALQTASDLDDYTYRVAGCVGEFWTRICLQNHFRTTQFLQRQGSSADTFEILGVRFGKGLQLVNILRDLPADLRNGRCYVPVELLEAASLTPLELMDPAVEPQFRPVYRALLDQAQAHLVAGWRYTNLIPRSELRLRLACAWPILIGLETLQRLRSRNVLDASQRIKISRRDVQGILLKSILLYPLPHWKRLAPVGGSD